MGISKNGKITKEKVVRTIPFFAMTCKFCPDIITMSSEKEAKHTLFHSIERLECSEKGKRILQIIFENTIISINDFEVLANQILEALGETAKWKFIECMEKVNG